MEDMSLDLLQKLPYWSFWIATAGAFYAGTRWIGTHFRPQFNKDLSNWLSGHYESTWSTHFCTMFDTVFGEEGFSWKRLIRSSIASLLSVLLLYILFTRVLDVLGTRTLGALDLLQVVLLGAMINIIPDYLSLMETRWLLGRFRKVTCFFGQLLLLIVDFIFTIVIIFLMISAYSWFFNDGRIPTAIELFALFSV